MQEDQIKKLIDEITSDLIQKGLLGRERQDARAHFSLPEVKQDASRRLSPPQSLAGLTIDLPDSAAAESRRLTGIRDPQDEDGLQALMEVTPAGVGVGRAGPRYRTPTWLRFQADHAVTQDALYREVDENWLSGLGLFGVQTRITGGKHEYLLRPDLGRQLSEDAKRMLQERCQKQPAVQICVGDGLSAAAIEANLEKILPVLQNGFQSAGLSLGTPFFIRYCRVGVMNDIGDLIEPDVLILLLGERPGLGRANSMSAYMGYRPRAGLTDADRDVICNIYDGGGTNPLEAGAYVVQLAQKMMHHQASGVGLRLLESGKGA